jgi:hypothetical protein
LGKVVEAASALARVSRIVLHADAHPEPSPEDLVFYATQTAAAVDEGGRVLARVPYASPKLSELLTGIENQALFAKTGVSAVWVRETGLPLLLEYADKRVELPRFLADLKTLIRR